MSNYIHTPKTISYNNIVECDFSLSSSRHKKFEIANQNCKLVKDFLTHDLSRNEPTRVFRRQFILSHATLADSSNWR